VLALYGHDPRAVREWPFEDVLAALAAHELAGFGAWVGQR